MNRSKEAGALMRRTYGTDPFAICDALGIPVLEVPLPDELKGFYSRQYGRPMIYLNEKLEGPERRMVCGHELGHAMLHESCNSLYLKENTLFCQERFEREADTFCAWLLLEDREPWEQETREQIAARTGLPLRLVELRWPMG